jgi:cell division protein FtsL
MLILLASILFYILIVAYVQKRNRQLQAQTIAIAQQRQQRLRQQQRYDRF